MNIDEAGDETLAITFALFSWPCFLKMLPLSISFQASLRVLSNFGDTRERAKYTRHTRYEKVRPCLACPVRLARACVLGPLYLIEIRGNAQSASDLNVFLSVFGRLVGEL